MSVTRLVELDEIMAIGSNVMMEIQQMGMGAPLLAKLNLDGSVPEELL